jgi:predicted dehydrogenase
VCKEDVQIASAQFIQRVSHRRAWLAQLGTHLVDYVLWLNGGHHAVWVVGHVHGREGLSDSHPSPDYVMGQITFANGVRAWVEFGYLAPQRLGDGQFWVDNRIALYGERGHVWAETDGRFCALGCCGVGDVEQFARWPEQERELLQAPYLRDLADWLDDDEQVHPCNGAISYHGYEVMAALCLSALDRRRIDLPLGDLPDEPLLDRLRRELPDG